MSDIKKKLRIIDASTNPKEENIVWESCDKNALVIDSKNGGIYRGNGTSHLDSITPYVVNERARYSDNGVSIEDKKFIELRSYEGDSEEFFSEIRLSLDEGFEEPRPLLEIKTEKFDKSNSKILMQESEISITSMLTDEFGHRTEKELTLNQEGLTYNNSPIVTEKVLDGHNELVRVDENGIANKSEITIGSFEIKNDKKYNYTFEGKYNSEERLADEDINIIAEYNHEGAKLKTLTVSEEYVLENVWCYEFIVTDFSLWEGADEEYIERASSIIGLVLNIPAAFLDSDYEEFDDIKLLNFIDDKSENLNFGGPTDEESSDITGYFIRTAPFSLKQTSKALLNGVPVVTEDRLIKSIENIPIIKGENDNSAILANLNNIATESGSVALGGTKILPIVGHYKLTGPISTDNESYYTYNININEIPITYFDAVISASKQIYNNEEIRLSSYDETNKTVTFTKPVDYYYDNKKYNPNKIINKYIPIGYYYQVEDYQGSTSNADGAISLGNATSKGILSVASNAAHAYAPCSLAEGNGGSSSKIGRHFQGEIVNPDSNDEEGYAGAYGVGSHVEGNLTVTTFAGSYGHAEGHSTVVNAYAGHAEGRQTLAGGTGSHAEGNSAIALGESAHAEGFSGVEYGSLYFKKINEPSDLIKIWKEGYVDASGKIQHKQGFLLAYGDNSHAEGENTLASNRASHSQGIKTSANGIAAFSSGINTISDGDYSFAGGEGSNATGKRSFAMGNKAFASGENSISFVGGSFHEDT